MASPRIVALQRKLDGIKSDMDTLESAAAASPTGDFTEQQQAAHADLVNRAAAVKTEIEQATAAHLGILEAQATLAKLNGGEPAPVNRATAVKDLPDLSVGEFLAGFYQAYHPEGASAPEEFLDRAAKYIDRAQQTTADTAGILPDPIIGPVIKLADSRRPVFLSLTSRPMPARGKTFQRPRITQRTTAGTQTEGQALSTQKMTVASETVTKSTQGGYLDLTQQDIDWTEPSALELLVQDFVDTYAEWTEGLFACDFVESMPVAADAANDGDGYSAWTTTNVGTIVASVVNGIVDVYDRSKRVADTFWVDMATWATLASTTNSNNDVTALEMIRKAVMDLMSQIGGNGFRFVVGPQFAADTRIIGVSSLGERYEQQNGLLRAIQPSVLAVQMAYSGYTAFYGRHEGFVQLGTDPD